MNLLAIQITEMRIKYINKYVELPVEMFTIRYLEFKDQQDIEQR